MVRCTIHVLLYPVPSLGAATHGILDHGVKSPGLLDDFVGEVRKRAGMNYEHRVLKPSQKMKLTFHLVLPYSTTGSMYDILHM